jgi:hypothetical protein
MRNLLFRILVVFLTVSFLGCGGTKDAAVDSDSPPTTKPPTTKPPTTKPVVKKPGPPARASRRSETELNLAYIDASYFAAAFVRPADLAAEEAFQALPDELRTHELLVDFKLTPEQVTEVVFLFASDAFHSSSQPSIILRLEKGTDAASIVQENIVQGNIKDAPVAAEEYAGFFLQGDPRGGETMAVKGQLLIVCGTKAKLKAMLHAGDVSSPLKDKLKQADPSRQVVVAFSLAPVRTDVDELIQQAGKQLPPMLAPMASAGKAIDSGLIYADLAGSKLLDIQMEAVDESGAVELKTALEAGVGALQFVYPRMKAQFLADSPFPLDDRVTGIADQLVKSLSLAGEGTSVSVTLDKPAGLTEAVVAMTRGAEEAREAMTGINNFKSILLGIHTYESSYRSLPPSKSASFLDKDGKPFVSWRVHLLPFIEEHELAKKFRLDEPWDSEHNLALLDQMPALYQTGADPTKTTIMGFVSGPSAKVRTGMATTSSGSSPGLRDFTDGLSNTALIFEFPPEAAVPWTKPDDISYDAEKPLPLMGKPNEDFVTVGFADGSADKIPKDMPVETWRALITRDGGEVVERP